MNGISLRLLVFFPVLLTPDFTEAFIRQADLHHNTFTVEHKTSIPVFIQGKNKGDIGSITLSESKGLQAISHEGYKVAHFKMSIRYVIIGKCDSLPNPPPQLSTDANLTKEMKRQIKTTFRKRDCYYLEVYFTDIVCSKPGKPNMSGQDFHFRIR